MAEGGLLANFADNQFAGKTLGDVLEYPNQQYLDVFGGANAPATNENVSYALAQTNRLKPSALQSSGPEGGWFSGPVGPGNVGQWASPGPQSIMAGYNAPAGLANPSTNNWRLLPPGWNQPKYAVRNGHIIDRYWVDKPLSYVDYRGGEPTAQMSNLGGPGFGYPISFGNSVSRGYFWPGQIEPWYTEGGPGTT